MPTDYAVDQLPELGTAQAAATFYCEYGDVDYFITFATLSAGLAGTYQPLAAGLTQLAAITGVRGDVIYYGASGWTRLAAGTAGHVLQTGGAGADPSWTAQTGGGGGTWGSITGTLASQTDLQSALDARQPLDADLTALAALATTGWARRTGASTWTLATPTYSDVGADQAGAAAAAVAAHEAASDPHPGYLTAAEGAAAYVPLARTVSAGTGLSGGGDLSADRTLAVEYGTSSTTACRGDDARLSDARTPTSHTHPATGISDSTATGRAVLTAADAAAAQSAAGVRRVLAANTTYYVSDSTGSDTTGDGSSGSPWKTIQKAVNHVSGLDCGTYDVTVSVASGTYAPFSLKSFLGSGMAKIEGNTTTPTNVVVSSTSGIAVSGNAVQGTWTIAGLKITTSGSGTHGVYLFGAPCNLTIDRCRFSACVSNHIVALSGAVIFLLDYSIDGSTGATSCHAYSAGGSIRCDTRTITGSGSPAFGNGSSGGFAVCDRAGLIYWPGATFTGFGSATGRRYYAQSCGILVTSGGGSSFPGNVAGSVDPATYGVYS